MTSAAPRPALLTERMLHEVAETYGTPIFVYDETAIRAGARELRQAFRWSPGYRNHFAVKACPTPAILRVLADEGMGFDCSSLGELVLVSETVPDAPVFFTSNNTTDEEYRIASQLNATINLDKASELERVFDLIGVPERMSIRYTPGRDDVSQPMGNAIIGPPLKSKFGDTRDNVGFALKRMKTAGVRELGLHTMLASNELEPEFFERSARMMRDTAQWLIDVHSVELSFLNLGGGLGVNYSKCDSLPSFDAVSESVRRELGRSEVSVVTEFGRRITGPHGILLTRVTHGFVESHDTYLQIDTSINNIPGFASDTTNLHHIEVLNRDSMNTRVATLVGSLCTGSDRMFRDRQVPASTEPGDLVAVHDAGAHARAKAHNYNFRLRAGEVLVSSPIEHRLIRRSETVDDLLATIRGL
ncbi:MAG: diaminopimelate decarboxylase [Myxococcota bacterium]